MGDSRNGAWASMAWLELPRVRLSQMRRGPSWRWTGAGIDIVQNTSRCFPQFHPWLFRLEDGHACDCRGGVEWSGMDPRRLKLFLSSVPRLSLVEGNDGAKAWPTYFLKWEPAGGTETRKQRIRDFTSRLHLTRRHPGLTKRNLTKLFFFSLCLAFHFCNALGR